MILKHWNNKTEELDTFENKQNNLTTHESFNQFINSTYGRAWILWSNLA